MLKNIKSYIFIASILIITACSDDEPEHIHEGEVITKVTLTFTNLADSSTQTIIWEDDHEGEDGHDHGDDDDHGDEGAHVEIDLAPDSSYTVAIKFENTSDPDNIEDVTLEVINEADEHQVFYEIVGLDNLTIESADDDETDGEGNRLNIKTTWTTTAAASGDVIAYLIHEPTSKTGTTRDDFGGETDVEVDYEVHIE